MFILKLLWVVNLTLLFFGYCFTTRSDKRDMWYADVLSLICYGVGGLGLLSTVAITVLKL